MLYERCRTIAWILAGLTCLAAAESWAVQLWIGAAAADITPDRSVPLTGYQAVRVSRGILSRARPTSWPWNRGRGTRCSTRRSWSPAICASFAPGIQEAFRKHVAGRLPKFDINKLFLAATHTHTAPEILQERYDEGLRRRHAAEGIRPVHVRADGPGSRTGVGEPGRRRRRLGAGTRRGRAQSPGGVRRRFGRMYGNTNDPQFRGIEGYEDHAVEVLCCYDLQQRLKAAAIALACPSQSVGGSKLSADFWHDVRRLLQERHGEQLHVLGFCARPAIRPRTSSTASRPRNAWSGSAASPRLRNWGAASPTPSTTCSRSWPRTSAPRCRWCTWFVRSISRPA